MRRVDERHLKAPHFGGRRTAIWLARDGEEVDRGRVRRPMGLTGLGATHPGPRTAVRNPDREAHPRPLRGATIERRDRVRPSDVTCIPTHQGLMWPTAVIDRHGRHVLSRRLSHSPDDRPCPEALEEAPRGGEPEVFGADQGARCTARSLTSRPEAAGVSVSMDGRGRALGDVFVERLWRSLKYEEVYLKGHRSVAESVTGLTSWFRFYNEERPRQGLKYRTPAEVYHGAERGSG